VSRALVPVIAILCLLPDLPALGWRAIPAWGALVAGIAVTLAAPGR
jgi:hypothetical protein